MDVATEWKPIYLKKMVNEMKWKRTKHTHTHTAIAQNEGDCKSNGNTDGKKFKKQSE